MYQDSVPAVAAAYGSSGFGDDLVYASLFLALATNSSAMYAQAEAYYAQYSLGGQDDVFNWDSKTPALAVLFAEIASSRPSVGSDVSKWQTEAERYFDNIIDGKSQGFLTKGTYIRPSLARDANKCSGGLLWYDQLSDDSSLNFGLDLAQLMYLYSPLASSPTKQASYIVRLLPVSHLLVLIPSL